MTLIRHMTRTVTGATTAPKVPQRAELWAPSLEALSELPRVLACSRYLVLVLSLPPAGSPLWRQEL
jgi:hypothetical protein